MVGVFDQDGTGTTGYELWAMGYDGSRNVLGILPAHSDGDINGDGGVDVIDLLILVDAFGTQTGDANYDAACDLNHDGAVDVIDLLTFVEDWPR